MDDDDDGFQPPIGIITIDAANLGNEEEGNDSETSEPRQPGEQVNNGENAAAEPNDDDEGDDNEVSLLPAPK